MPEIKYSVIAKNGHGTLPFDGKDMIWVEPGSNVILKIKEGSKFYDFVPIVYNTGKNIPKILTILPGKEISAAKETMVIDYKKPPTPKRLSNNERIVNLSNFNNINKLNKGYYKIQVNQFTSLSFDKEVFIIGRNNMLAGSQYFTKNLIAYPREKIIINISGETHVKK
ncbi:hypothetical protein [Klebsiella variicola]|uniref:hypothetical protein n=1 Tax=Klebsiella variicola TaxID=244366 RepID=UPI0034D1907D